MEKLYIAFVDTPGFFASLIRRVVKMNYVHTVLGFDEDLFEAYSVGRRNPAVPIFSGFEKEELDRIYKKFPNAGYKITYIECTKKQKDDILNKMRELYKVRYSYKYCIIGLPFILMNKPFYQKNHYTCSSFISRVLAENGIKLFDKHFSLVTPKDFYNLDLPCIYEGKIEPLAKKYIKSISSIKEGGKVSEAKTELVSVSESLR